MNNGSLSNIKSIILDIEFIKESAIFDEDFIASDEKEFASLSDKELVVSNGIVSDNKKSVVSDLSYITNVNNEEYINEYNAIFNKISSNPSNIFQEFSFKEYAKFMYIITRFYI